MRIPFTCLAPAILAAVIGTAPLAAQNANSNQLKAAIIYNILRFVDFGGTGSTGTLDVCGKRDATSIRDLASLNGRPIGSRTINFRIINSAQADGCDVVYLGLATRAEISQASQRGRITIGDGPAFISSGGIIGLVQMGSQIRFETNVGSAKRSQIGISSKLLRLATRIQQ